MSASNGNSTLSIIVSNSSKSWLTYFWIMLCSNILSIICCIFVLFHLLSDRILRCSLHNHAIIIILFLSLLCELTDIPLLLFFYRWNFVWINTPTFCRIWKYIDIVIYVATARLVAWISIERHILIFHAQWVSTKNQRFFLHYLPLIFIVAYSIIYYAITICMLRCGEIFRYNMLFCGYIYCVQNNSAVLLYELFSGGIFCSLTIALFSITLAIRVVWQKRRVHQPIQWRKHRKMTIQLLSITSLFYVIYLPPILISIIQLIGIPIYVTNTYQIFSAQFLSYYITFLFPFVCLNSLPRLKSRIKNSFRWWYSRRQVGIIVPQQFPLRTQTCHPLAK